MVRSTDRMAWLLGSCVFAVACGASEEAPSVFGPSTSSPSGGPATLPDGIDGPIPGFGQVGDGLGLGGAIKVEGLRIEPENAVLEVASGQRSSLAFKVYGRVNGATSERELTVRAAFYVPDNHLVGSFPSNGSNTFQSRLPASLSEPAQRGGVVTVQAQVANSDGTLATVKTNLTVRLNSDLRTSNGGASVPSSPETRFAGSAKPSRAPRIVYPNDGVLLPPNLRRLEVHWAPGSAANQLFEVAFNSALGKIRYYTRCGAGSAAFKAGSCALELDEQGYAFLAETNRGGGPVTLTVRGASDTGGEFGESAPTRLTFAETDVAGGIYYWTVSKPPRIMRFDFGGQAKTPEEFLRPSTNGLSESCVGCHTLSRDGSKLIASVGGQKDGRLVFLQDLTKPVGSAGWLTQGGTSIAAAQNRIQFASFNPTGSEVVATYGDDAALGSPFKPADLDPRKLWFLDGNTGLRKGSLALPFKPDHPEWSPNGAMIAMTRVGNETATAQRPTRGGLEMIKATGTGWGAAQTLVPIQPGYNRYNPNFVPDSSFLLYSESVCPTADWDGPDCDADSDSSAKTWAMASTPGSPRVLLAKAAAGGVADGGRKDLADTFPRSTPFQSKQGSGKLFWFTVASRREPGLRAKTDDNQQLLWMFAVDPAAILAGKDGSYPGFYLPFQDLKTSNHIAQWTQKIVSDNPPPPPAPAPPPPPPPVPTR